MLLSFFFFFLKFLREREKERKNETLSLSLLLFTNSFSSFTFRLTPRRASSLKVDVEGIEITENSLPTLHLAYAAGPHARKILFQGRIFCVFFEAEFFFFGDDGDKNPYYPPPLSPPCSHPPNTSVDVVIPRSAMYTAKAFGLEILSLAAKESTNRSKAGAMARARENRSGRTKFCAIQNAE